jgi:hypothetical protein
MDGLLQPDSLLQGYDCGKIRLGAGIRRPCITSAFNERMTPALLRYFDIAPSSMQGIPVQDMPASPARGCFFVLSHIPDLHNPRVFSRYRCVDGRWKFKEHIATFTDTDQLFIHHTAGAMGAVATAVRQEGHIECGDTCLRSALRPASHGNDRIRLGDAFLARY